MNNKCVHQWKLDSHWVTQLTDRLQGTIDNLIICNAECPQMNENDFSNLLIDFSNATDHEAGRMRSTVDKMLANGKFVILLNVQNAETLSEMLGFGIQGQCVIVRPYKDSVVVNVLGTPEEWESTKSQKSITQDRDGNHHVSEVKDSNYCSQECLESMAPFQELTVYNQVNKIKCILNSRFEPPAQMASTPLPLHQYKLVYLVLEAMWNVHPNQVTNNSVVMEISLIASYNPQYKYLRIRSLGAGFNPTNGKSMNADNEYNRGYFQSKINIHMQPVSNQLRVLSTEPKNVNNKTEYTAGSSFSVGVDISKNPGFNPSYTVSESHTTQISDFNVYNNSAGVTADWLFILSMLEKSVWDMFNERFMRKAQVKHLPALATRNLQPVAETVWYGSNTLNDTVGVQLFWSVEHQSCWVTGNWSNYTMHSHHPSKTVGFADPPFYINFGEVYA